MANTRDGPAQPSSCIRGPLPDERQGPVSNDHGDVRSTRPIGWQAPLQGLSAPTEQCPLQLSPEARYLKGRSEAQRWIAVAKIPSQKSRPVHVEEVIFQPETPETRATSAYFTLSEAANPNELEVVTV